MRKKTILIAALALSSLGIHAEEGVIIHMQDNSKVGFVFSNEPVLKTGATLVIKTTTEEVSYEYSQVKDVCFGDITTTAIGSVNNNTVKSLFRLTPSGLEVEGLGQGEQVFIYSLDGKLINMATNTNGKANITLPDNDKSVYVVRTSNGTSFKFNRK